MSWLAAPLGGFALTYAAIGIGWLGRVPESDRQTAMIDLALRSVIGLCGLLAAFGAGLLL